MQKWGGQDKFLSALPRPRAGPLAVEKLAKSGEVLVGEGFSREFALAFLAAYQWPPRLIRAAR
jgi:hypothetical protein